MREEFSIYRIHEDLVDFANVTSMLESSTDDDIVNIECRKRNENVCHGQKGIDEDFFYFYTCLFTNAHVKLPFDEMTMQVLRVLNVAPNQLHPNSWVALQTFRLVCRMLNLTVSHQILLFFLLYLTGELGDMAISSWLTKVVFFGSLHNLYKHLAPYTTFTSISKNHFSRLEFRRMGRNIFTMVKILCFLFIGPIVLPK